MTNYKGLNLRFEYAIRFSNGKYYIGENNKYYMEDYSKAYTYTFKGAHAKIDRMGWDATVEHV